MTEPVLRRPGSRVGLMSLCPPASFCEIPSTNFPLQISPIKPCRQALESCFRKFLIDPQNNHKCKSISKEAVTRKGMVVQEKALSKAKKGQLQDLNPRELVCEWRLAS